MFKCATVLWCVCCSCNCCWYSFVWFVRYYALGKLSSSSSSTAPICVMLCVRAASVISYIENTFLFLLLVDMNQLKKRTLLHICYGYWWWWWWWCVVRTYLRYVYLFVHAWQTINLIGFTKWCTPLSLSLSLYNATNSIAAHILFIMHDDYDDDDDTCEYL